MSECPATRGFGKRRLSFEAASIVEAWHAEELLRFREDVSALMPYYDVPAQLLFEFITAEL